MTKSRGLRPPKRFWTEVEVELLSRNYADSRTEDLAIALGRKLQQVYAKAKKLRLAKSEAYLASPDACRLRRGDNVGAAHRFKPCQVPPNKGKKMPPGWAPGHMAKTQFKPGQLSGRAAQLVIPVGGYRINGDTFVEVKFSEIPGPYTNRWIPVHRKVWIEANGPVPKGFVIAFKPGMKTLDPKLVTLDRLECITFADNLKRNSFHRYGPEVVKVVQLRAAITRQINKRAKLEEPHEQ